MHTARTDDTTPAYQRCCRRCYAPVMGGRIGKAPACQPCRQVELARLATVRGQRASHVRDEAQRIAHKAVRDAVRHGDLPRASDVLCEDRDSMSPCAGLHAWHHDDYSRPLDVRCLCQSHHSWWHSRNGATRGELVKCAKYGCRQETTGVRHGWRCDAHSPKPRVPMWTPTHGGWRVRGKFGSGLVSKCRDGFNVKLYHDDLQIVRVHTPDELREQMRLVYAIVTGVAA